MSTLLLKSEILATYGVVPTSEFDPNLAIRRRVEYLKSFLTATRRKAFVLGISGGVDSTVTGVLCQLACSELRAEGYAARFVAVRLPAGVQRDEADAQAALAVIRPDVVLTVNVGPASNAIHTEGLNAFITAEGGSAVTPEQADFHKGNVKARMRMLAQYEQAALFEGLVVGTDHNAEAVTGFFTLFGDGACDLTVLNGLNKRQIRLMAKAMGASETLWNKAPTADLEELNPGKLDDDGFGFPYDLLDDFLEGIAIPKEVEAKILARFEATRFKRRSIPGFGG